MIRGRMVPTQDAAINSVLKQTVETFENPDNTEQAFKDMVNNVPADVCDEMLEALRGQRNMKLKVEAYALMIPQYRTLVEHIRGAENAKLQLEEATKYYRPGNILDS